MAKSWKDRFSRKAVIRFCFSELGLVIIINAYIILGGLLFKAIEHGDEVDKADEVRKLAIQIQEQRKKMHSEIFLATEEAIEWGWNRTDTVKAYKEILDKYQLMLREAIDKGYNGKVIMPEEEQYGWEIYSATLFTATILTTIGYGHVAPKTELGRLVTMLYAVLALPLMSIFVIKVGAAVGKAVRSAYHRGCCRPCKKRRYHAHDGHRAGGRMNAWGTVSEVVLDEIPDTGL